MSSSSRRMLLGLAFVSVLAVDVGLAWAASSAAASTRSRAETALMRLPLGFEENHGQADPHATFVARARGYTVWLAADGAALRLGASGGDLLHVRFVGASPVAQLEGVDRLPGQANYLLGRTRSRWRTHVPTYARVRYRETYPGIDLVFYGNERRLEYDVIVAPGADPSVVRLALDGAARVEIDADGDLVLGTRRGEVRLQRPQIYQDVDGVRQSVAGGWRLEPRRDGDGSTRHVGFEVAAYDARRALVIDPVISYSTYFGGSGSDEGFAIALHTDGTIFMTGTTTSPDLPMSPAPPYDDTVSMRDVFVARISADGGTLLYRTYLGGEDDERVLAIAVDGSGNAHVTGRSKSDGFPTVNAYQPDRIPPDFDAFVTKLNADGTDLVYSTYLGSTALDVGTGIAIDVLGNAHVVGTTAGGDVLFPTTPNALPPGENGEGGMFIVRLAADGALLYATRFTPVGDDFAGVTTDALGNTYLTGTAMSADLVTTPGVVHPTDNAGANEGFVAKLTAGDALTPPSFNPHPTDVLLGGYLTYHPLRGKGIAVDGQGYAYVSDGRFVTKLAPDAANHQYATDVGNTRANRVAIDAAGNAYAVGSEFVSKLAPAGNLVSQFLIPVTGTLLIRGVALDACGNPYVAGETNALALPPAPTTLYPTKSDSFDAFVLGLSPGPLAFVPDATGVSLVDTSLLALDGPVVPLGSLPGTVAADPTSRRAFIPNWDGHKISVIDATTPVQTITHVALNDPVPVGIAVSLDGTRVYAVHPTGTVSVLDATTSPPSLLPSIPLTMPVTGVPAFNAPFGIAVSPNGERLYITNQNADSTGSYFVTIVDASAGQVLHTVTVGATPQGIAVHPTGNPVYVANFDGASLSVIDVTGPMPVTTTVNLMIPAPLPHPSKPFGVAVHPDGARVYVTNQQPLLSLIGTPLPSVVWVVDTATLGVTDTVLVSGHARGVAVTPDGVHVYVASFGKQDVIPSSAVPGALTVFQALNNTVVKTFTAADGLVPRPIALGQFISGQGICKAAAVSPGMSMPTGDSFVRRRQEHANEGANERLAVGADDGHRALVAFDLSRIPRDVRRVRLVLNVAEPASRWGRAGGLVDAQRLLDAFTEGNGEVFHERGRDRERGSGPGVTWRCATDTEIGDRRPGCRVDWDGGTRAAAPPTARSVVHTNGMNGPVVWDVTADVLEAVRGGAPTIGWLIRERDESRRGSVLYYSREGARAAGDPGMGPRLLFD